MRNKPIEHRQLHHESSESSQGTIVTWLDIIDRNDHEEMNLKWNIQPEPENPYQLRVVVYHGENVKM